MRSSESTRQGDAFHGVLAKSGELGGSKLELGMHYLGKRRCYHWSTFACGRPRWSQFLSSPQISNVDEKPLRRYKSQ